MVFFIIAAIIVVLVRVLPLSKSMLKFANNTIYFLLFYGWMYSIIYYFLGALLYLIDLLLKAFSVNGKPLSTSPLEIAKMSVAPFGKEVVNSSEIIKEDFPTPNLTRKIIENTIKILWGFTFGILLCVSHFTVGILLCVTVIFLPYGVQHIKLSKNAFSPFDKTVIPINTYIEMYEKRTGKTYTNSRF